MTSSSCISCGNGAAESETHMERNYSNGQQVVFVDRKGQRHDALITRWWAGTEPDPEREGSYRYGLPTTEWIAANGMPGCNLVFVTSDGTKQDPYGYQIERETSVCHKSKQPAPGNYWCFADELT